MDSAVAESRCPFHAEQDDRKSAAIAKANVHPLPEARVVRGFNLSREVLRSPNMRQAGAGADQVKVDNPDHVSFFFLDGEAHRKRRAAIASFFAPKTIVTRYHAVMHRTMDGLIAELQSKGSAKLDELSFQMAVDVAAQIVGLTETDGTTLAKHMRGMMGLMELDENSTIKRFFQKARLAFHASRFYRKDIAPAVAARRKAPREDVISYMVAENYSKQSMIIECLTYGTAGMVTTREFIVMCAWHLFDNEALRERFLGGSEADQFAILEEILRLEPVAALLYRRVNDAMMASDGERLPEGELLALDIRAGNSDPAVAGECPFALDPDRAKRMKVLGSYLSFGDGNHRCPGSQVALHETRIFLDRLLRVPGIRLERAPDISWFEMLQSYELRGAIVTIEPGSAR